MMVRVPARAVPVRLAFKSIVPFQVGTVGEHTNTFIGGDSDGAIHQVGGVEDTTVSTSVVVQWPFDAMRLNRTLLVLQQ